MPSTGESSWYQIGAPPPAAPSASVGAAALAIRWTIGRAPQAIGKRSDAARREAVDEAACGKVVVVVEHGDVACESLWSRLAAGRWACGEVTVAVVARPPSWLEAFAPLAALPYDSGRYRDVTGAARAAKAIADAAPKDVQVRFCALSRWCDLDRRLSQCDLVLAGRPSRIHDRWWLARRLARSM